MRDCNGIEIYVYSDGDMSWYIDVSTVFCDNFVSFLPLMDAYPVFHPSAILETFSVDPSDYKQNKVYIEGKWKYFDSVVDSINYAVDKSLEFKGNPK